jgi:hypothetical protein
MENCVAPENKGLIAFFTLLHVFEAEPKNDFTILVQAKKQRTV